MFTIQLPEIKTQTLAVKLTARGERSVRKEHPWLFKDSIEKINKKGNSGDVAIIFSQSNNKVIGVGLYDPDSPIRIKMVHHNSGAKLHTAFFDEKIKSSFDVRTPLFKTKTNSYRLIFGENDGFPGFIADVYNKVLVVKIYNGIWFPYLQTILESLIDTTRVTTVVLRLSRSLQAKNPFSLEDGQVLYGELKNENVIFQEHGIAFAANVIKGHKTGYFLDHRANRKRVGELSKGKTVLDVFSYAGGFSIHALAKGATEVTSLDISKQALDVAKENGKLNKHNGVHKVIVGDAFEALQQLIDAHKTFDVVVIDPPSFAKSKKEIVVARKKYNQLARLGTQLVAAKGLLVLASCSSRILAEDFFEINSTALSKQSKNYKLILQTEHDIDHPVGFPEGAYLKCGYYRFK